MKLYLPKSTKTRVTVPTKLNSNIDLDPRNTDILITTFTIGPCSQAIESPKKY